MRTNISVVDLTTSRKIFALSEGTLIEEKYEGNAFYKALKEFKLWAPQSTQIKSIKTEFEADNDNCKIIINDGMSSRLALVGKTGIPGGTGSYDTVAPGKPYTTEEKTAIEDAILHNMSVKDDLKGLIAAVNNMLITAESMIDTLEARSKEITEDISPKTITILA